MLFCDEPLLDFAFEAEPKEAVKHLTKVANGLAADKTLTRAERRDLTARLAKVMADKVRRPEDVEAILGAKAKKQVAREVYYRRYLEHWLFESPVALCVTLDCAKGQDPVVRAIHAWLRYDP